MIKIEDLNNDQLNAKEIEEFLQFAKRWGAISIENKLSKDETKGGKVLLKDKSNNEFSIYFKAAWRNLIIDKKYSELKVGKFLMLDGTEIYLAFGLEIIDFGNILQ